jgi:adenylate cyclase
MIPDKGDTVNVASRMESHGAAGAIQVSEATASIVADRFVVEPRGEIEIKGKGKMRTFGLREPRP